MTQKTADMAAAHADTAVRIVDAHLSLGKQPVLKGVSLQLAAGRVHGLLGPSGCGKTTLVNLIIGSLRPDSGSVTVLGGRAGRAEARSQTGFMPQSEALYNDLTAHENMSFFASLYGIRPHKQAAAIDRALTLSCLQNQGKKLVASFSGGMKRRLSLAIALLHRPRLLMLDEPTVGLDPQHRITLWQGFRELANEGATLFVTTHVMDEAASCDDVWLLHEGRLIAHGSPTDLVERTGTASLEEAFLQLEGDGDV